eukprot:COSAG05_NODE_10917_length_539_cov_0.922727_1_plen_25_part_01
MGACPLSVFHLGASSFFKQKTAYEI